jgi:hypothetical protein
MDIIETEFSGATIRRRKKNETPLSDSMVTPKWLADRLPLVDLDPASNPRSHIKARWTYSLEKKLDGLKLPWRGSVFLNWPYSKPAPWALKLIHELVIGNCTGAIVLPKSDHSTDWWTVLTQPVRLGGHIYRPDLWLFDDRIQFEEPPELIEQRRLDVLAKRAAGKKATEKTSNNFCNAIVHHRLGGDRLQLDDVATLWVRP